MYAHATSGSSLRGGFWRRLPVALALVLAVWMTVGGTAARAQGAINCIRLTQFDPANFPPAPVINSSLMPLTPGSQRILEGVSNVNGQTLPHQVTFTVTDLTKVVDGVRVVVVYDVDVSNGEQIEGELSFWAQDNVGNVWNLGEYPEEYANGALTGAPFTWISSADNAEAGIHVPAPTTAVGGPIYIQGYAPSINFLDCGQTFAVNQTTTVAAGTFNGVTVIDETSPLDPAGGSQRKHYAPGVGIVQIGAVNDPQGETLQLSSQSTLDPTALDDIRAKAFTLDSRGYQISPTVYGTTSPAQGPPGTAPPPGTPPPPPGTPVDPAVAAATTAAATAGKKKKKKKKGATGPGAVGPYDLQPSITANKNASGLTVLLRPASRRLTRKGLLRLVVRCKGPAKKICREHASVYIRGTKTRIGRAGFSVRVGKPKTVGVPISKAARSRLRKARRLAVIVKVVGNDKNDKGLKAKIRLTLLR